MGPNALSAALVWPEFRSDALGNEAKCLDVMSHREDDEVANVGVDEGALSGDHLARRTREQGFVVDVLGDPTYQIEDFEGIQLVRRV